MKKLLIGALVGALILFVWQFLSFALLGIHNSQMDYTPNQDAILKVLEENLEEGTYFLPRAEIGVSMEEEEALMNERLGKPWAMVSYHDSLSNNMGMNMFRGFVIDFISAFLLAWLLMKMANLTFQTSVIASLAIGLIGYFTINYLNSVWFETNSIPDLIDAVVQWGLTGAWMGWWLTK